VPENAGTSKGSIDTHAGSAGMKSESKPPLRGALVLGAESAAALVKKLESARSDAVSKRALAPEPPSQSALSAKERIAIDYSDTEDLVEKIDKALKAFIAESPMKWKALRPQGIFRGSGPRGKIAFLYPGQGSQYVNMLKQLYKTEPIIAETFAEADK